MSKIAPGQRALWTFLFAVLIAPFFAAVFILAANLAAGTFGFGPASLKNLEPGALWPLAAGRALESYLWAAFPAGLAGAGLAALVIWRGTFGWLEAAIVGALAATLAAVSAGGQALNHVSFLALIGASIAVLSRAVLARARVIA